MPHSKPRVVLIAKDASCLIPLCGVPTLERLLRILQRLEFRQATVFAADPECIRSALDPRSWASSEIAVDVLPLTDQSNAGPVLHIPAELYCDARLLGALAECDTTTQLIDSAPPAAIQALLREPNSGAALIANGAPATLDAATQPTYVRSMRRHIRPVFFLSPPPQLLETAERIILDTAQNGALDLPGLIESPVETRILRRLCKTRITPNQISAFGVLVALIASMLFASGHLGWGIVVALTIGVIDGLDGKQARIKVETTPIGKLEHALDFVVETICWAALAGWFQRSGQLPQAWLLFAAIITAEIIGQLAKRVAHQRIGRLLDDYTAFDRFVRRIGARRGIYIWILAIGILCGSAPRAYEFCALWGIITAAVHTVRAAYIRLFPRQHPLGA